MKKSLQNETSQMMALANNTSFAQITNPQNAASMFLIGVLTVTTILSNFLVIVLVCTSRRLRTPFNCYLLNIAINDFLVGAIDMPYYALLTYYGYWPLSDLHCSIWVFFDFTVDLVSLWGLVAVSFDRVWAVTWPISYRHHNTFRKALLIISAGWLINYASILPGYVYTRTHFGHQSLNQTCEWVNEGSPSWASNFFIVVVDIFTPVILAVLCYAIIVFQMCRSVQRRQVGALNDDSGEGIPRRKKKDRQAFLVLTALVIACVVAWIPWFVCEVLQLVTKEEYPVLLAVTYWMSYGISAVNPFMFGIASGDMKHAFRKLCGRGKGRNGRVSTVTGKPSGAISTQHQSSNHE